MQNIVPIELRRRVAGSAWRANGQRHIRAHGASSCAPGLKLRVEGGSSCCWDRRCADLELFAWIPSCPKWGLWAELFSDVCLVSFC